MKKNFKYVALAVFAYAFLWLSAFAGERSDDDCQGWTGARNGQQSCQVSLYALLATPAIRDGQRVATFGYLLYEGGAFSMMGPSPDALRRVDFIGCIAVSPKEIEGQQPSALMKHGIYFVMAEGVYSKGAENGACVGRIPNAYISRISRFDEL